MINFGTLVNAGAISDQFELQLMFGVAHLVN